MGFELLKAAYAHMYVYKKYIHQVPDYLMLQPYGAGYYYVHFKDEKIEIK